MFIIKKLAIKELVFRISMLIILLVSFSYFFSYLNSIKNSKKPLTSKNIKKQKKLVLNNKKSSIRETTYREATSREITLRNVEKINAYIDEQGFLLSTLKENDKKIEPLLKSIEDNIFLIEKEARSKSVNNLINQAKIDEIKKSLISYKQIPIETKRNS